MQIDRTNKSDELAVYDLTELLQVAAHQVWPVSNAQPERPPAYRLALGKDPIQLGVIECRILMYLAGRPYHAFTRRNIADAINSDRYPIREDTVDTHVDSLIDQLGVFHDYVQAVPYVGYRFKA
jgi:DNA-binding response OmpR family regulator